MKAHMTKILVIDDDARDRGLLAAVLEERGYEVILADNGGTGLMLCHRRTPDAVVLDLNMPRYRRSQHTAAIADTTPRPTGRSF